MTAVVVSPLLSCGVNRGLGDPGGTGGSAPTQPPISGGGTPTPPPTGGGGAPQPPTGGGTSTPPLSGHLAVSDYSLNRILIYNAPLSGDDSASIVIGQTSFTQAAPNQGSLKPTASTLVSPTGLAMDSAGDLWVADTMNCRVLEFRPPFSTGMNASLVIGEPDFKTTGPEVPGYYVCIPEPSISASGLESPVSLTFDSSGDLWVSDIAADRVAEYVPPFHNGMAASVVIGQTNLENTGPCNGTDYFQYYPIPSPTAATLCQPSGIAFDSQGDLWVIDEGNVRILEFVPPFSTGMSASLELVGQPLSAFNSNGAICDETSASSFCYLDAIAFDKNGDLWVSDGTFDREMEFVPPFSNGMAASLVLQQHNFTPTGFDHAGDPTGGLFFDDSGNLIISDQVTQSAVVSGRVYFYAPPFSSVDSMASSMTILSGQHCPEPPDYIVTANAICNPTGLVTFP